MNVKLDENLGCRLQAEFQAAGHEVATVAGQGLSGAPDERVFAVCRAEQRILVTLDVGFGNLLRFPTEGSPGIAVLRSPEGTTYRTLQSLGLELIHALVARPIVGKLWVVEPGRIRERGTSEI